MKYSNQDEFKLKILLLTDDYCNQMSLDLEENGGVDDVSFGIIRSLNNLNQDEFKLKLLLLIDDYCN